VGHRSHAWPDDPRVLVQCERQRRTRYPWSRRDKAVATNRTPIRRGSARSIAVYADSPAYSKMSYADQAKGTVLLDSPRARPGFAGPKTERLRKGTGDERVLAASIKTQRLRHWWPNSSGCGISMRWWRGTRRLYLGRGLFTKAPSETGWLRRRMAGRLGPQRPLFDRLFPIKEGRCGPSRPASACATIQSLTVPFVKRPRPRYTVSFRATISLRCRHRWNLATNAADVA